MGCYLRVPVLSQSQLKKNQAELLIPDQQVENPIHALHGSKAFTLQLAFSHSKEGSFLPLGLVNSVNCIPSSCLGCLFFVGLLQPEGDPAAS